MIAVTALLIALVLAIAASIAFGVRSIPFEDAMLAVLGHMNNTDQSAAATRKSDGAPSSRWF